MSLGSRDSESTQTKHDSPRFEAPLYRTWTYTWTLHSIFWKFFWSNVKGGHFWVRPLQVKIHNTNIYEHLRTKCPKISTYKGITPKTAYIQWCCTFSDELSLEMPGAKIKAYETRELLGRWEAQRCLACILTG